MDEEVELNEPLRNTRELRRELLGLSDRDIGEQLVNSEVVCDKNSYGVEGPGGQIESASSSSSSIVRSGHDNVSDDDQVLSPTSFAISEMSFIDISKQIIEN